MYHKTIFKNKNNQPRDHLHYVRNGYKASHQNRPVLGIKGFLKTKNIR